MLLNTTGLVNIWNTGIPGSTQLNMSAGTTTTTGGSISFTAPFLSEGQSTWYNSLWWKAPTYGSGLWFEAPPVYSLQFVAGVTTTTGGTITFISSEENYIIDMSAGLTTTTGGKMTSSVPFNMTAGATITTGDSITFQLEYTSELFVISNSSTFDGLGIRYETDLAYNPSSENAYTILARVDIDSLFLDGIFGTPPQPYQILKHFDEMKNKAVVIVEYDGNEWQLISKTPISL